MTVSEKLRLVQGLHSHAEMFGFSWDDGSDWTWHDVACRIADEIDAEMTHMELHECPACANVADLQEAMDENAKLRELVKSIWDTRLRTKKNPSAYAWIAVQKEAEKLGIELRWEDA